MFSISCVGSVSNSTAITVAGGSGADARLSCISQNVTRNNYKHLLNARREFEPEWLPPQMLFELWLTASALKTNPSHLLGPHPNALGRPPTGSCRHSMFPANSRRRLRQPRAALPARLRQRSGSLFHAWSNAPIDASISCRSAPSLQIPFGGNR